MKRNEVRNSQYASADHLNQLYRERSADVSKEIRRIIKFGLVGLSGVGISIGILWLFTDVVGLFYIISAVVAHVLSVNNNFVWNHVWTFNDRVSGEHLSSTISRWLKFQLTTLAVAAVYLGVLTLLTEVFNVFYIASSLCAILVAFPTNFLTSTFWVWNKSTRNK